MNAIGEVINWNEIIKSCRTMNPSETLAQLKGMNFGKFICWGATNFTLDTKKNPRMLQFYVTGRKVTGFVYIFVNGLDLYDIYITDEHNAIVHKTEGEGLYFDDMTDWIDDRIEKVDGYRF